MALVNTVMGGGHDLAPQKIVQHIRQLYLQLPMALPRMGCQIEQHGLLGLEQLQRRTAAPSWPVCRPMTQARALPQRLHQVWLRLVVLRSTTRMWRRQVEAPCPLVCLMGVQQMGLLLQLSGTCGPSHQAVCRPMTQAGALP